MNILNAVLVALALFIMGSGLFLLFSGARAMNKK
jgi:hypothetical protein